MPSSSFDDEDNVRVSCFIEGRMGDPKSVEGNAVLDVIEAEGLQAHAQAVGEYLIGGLRALAEEQPLIGDVRGR